MPASAATAPAVLDHPQTLGNAERGEILFRGLPFVRLIRVIYRRQQFHRQQRAAGAINRLEGIQAPALPPVAPRFGAGIGQNRAPADRDQVGYHRYYRRGGEVKRCRCLFTQLIGRTA
ncbi:hypothetical protein J4732_02220 [Serratia marcescens]|uniref:Uncharacterized protein n=1 Tax=Serratia marcescens TaxID=615 RepID=A0A939NJF1_SERMA|nr:hypothetical protein [Serratia marcescens]